MDADSRQGLEELRDSVVAAERRFEVMADRIVDALARASAVNTNAANITVSAGGIGVWVASTACCVMVAVGIILAVNIHTQQRQIDDLKDYLSAIYMQAPHLKPQENE